MLYTAPPGTHFDIADMPTSMKYQARYYNLKGPTILSAELQKSIIPKSGVYPGFGPVSEHTESVYSMTLGRSNPLNEDQQYAWGGNNGPMMEFALWISVNPNVQTVIPDSQISRFISLFSQFGGWIAA